MSYQIFVIGGSTKPKEDKKEVQELINEYKYPFPYEEPSPAEVSTVNEEFYALQSVNKPKKWSIDKQAFVYDLWNKYQVKSAQNSNNERRSIMDSLSQYSKSSWKSNAFLVLNL